MKTETQSTHDKCKNCSQGYTREEYGAYPDHINLCAMHAAAPELLEACKKLLQIPDSDDQWKFWREGAIEAIAKAEGGN